MGRFWLILGGFGVGMHLQAGNKLGLLISGTGLILMLIGDFKDWKNRT